MENAYKRKKEPELNKQLILDAATDIGAAEDWHQVTFQAIADKTGLSKGGIIHHFRTKEELLDELMRQSLVELTEWLKQYKTSRKAKDGALGYLQFVIDKAKDEQYSKTMRIIIQAIIANPQYRHSWDDWYREHILPADGSALDINSEVAILVADGIWYRENIGFTPMSDAGKRKLLKHLSS